VLEFTCAGDTSGDACKVIKASTLDYVVNTKTGAVAWSVRENAGNYVATSGIYEKCAVVDRKNWQCTASDGEVVSLLGGIYRHARVVGDGAVFQGYADGKYRRERIREWLAGLKGAAWKSGG